MAAVSYAGTVKSNYISIIFKSSDGLVAFPAVLSRNISNVLEGLLKTHWLDVVRRIVCKEVMGE